MGHDGHDHDHDHGQGGPHHHEDAVHEHKSHAPAHVSAFVITCSDSRDLEKDESGQIAVQALEAAGHAVVGHVLVTDDADKIRAAIAEAQLAGARAVILNGGTGIGRRDVTIESVEPLFEKKLPGFGELFRALSYAEIGSAAIMSRASAGTYQGLVIFALPGSPKAVRLGMTKLILPELGHAVRELTR